MRSALRVRIYWRSICRISCLLSFGMGGKRLHYAMCEIKDVNQLIPERRLSREKSVLI